MTAPRRGPSQNSVSAVYPPAYSLMTVTTTSGPVRAPMIVNLAAHQSGPLGFGFWGSSSTTCSLFAFLLRNQFFQRHAHCLREAAEHGQAGVAGLLDELP